MKYQEANKWDHRTLRSEVVALLTHDLKDKEVLSNVVNSSEEYFHKHPMDGQTINDARLYGQTYEGVLHYLEVQSRDKTWAEV